MSRPKGFKHSEETKEKLRQMRLGKNNPFFGKRHTPETKQKISDATRGEKNFMFGKHHSETTRQKISEARKGQRDSEETRRKKSESHKGEKNYWFGKHLPKAAKRKISEANKGHTRWVGRKHTEESKRKMRARHISEEHKQRLREFHLGKPLSEETRRKMSETRRGENNNNWRGGKSFEPYSTEFGIVLKRRIRKRDKGICWICGKPNSKDVHHINYDKKDNRDSNLVTLCRSCHSKTNSARNFWCGSLFLELLLSN